MICPGCNRSIMKPHSLSIILLFLLVNILKSKHFQIEVEDDEMKQENQVI